MEQNFIIVIIIVIVFSVVIYLLLKSNNNSNEKFPQLNLSIFTSPGQKIYFIDCLMTTKGENYVLHNEIDSKLYKYMDKPTIGYKSVTILNNLVIGQDNNLYLLIPQNNTMISTKIKNSNLTSFVGVGGKAYGLDSNKRLNIITKINNDPFSFEFQPVNLIIDGNTITSTPVNIYWIDNNENLKIYNPQSKNIGKIQVFFNSVIGYEFFGCNEEERVTGLLKDRTLVYVTENQGIIPHINTLSNIVKYRPFSCGSVMASSNKIRVTFDDIDEKGNVAFVTYKDFDYPEKSVIKEISVSPCSSFRTDFSENLSGNRKLYVLMSNGNLYRMSITIKTGSLIQMNSLIDVFTYSSFELICGNITSYYALTPKK